MDIAEAHANSRDLECIQCLECLETCAVKETISLELFGSSGIQGIDNP